MRLVLDCLYLTGMLLASPWLVWRRLRGANGRGSEGALPEPPPTGGIWLHGASVGEVSLIRPLIALLEGERARRVVDAVEARLLTPLGLRSLAPGDPEYVGRYEGGVRVRDGAYHQGSAWPWLIGPFVEAWLRVRGNTTAARREAKRRFLTPLLAHLDEAGLGHVSEIADGDPPQQARGCPFQAWSVGEVLRLRQILG